MVRDKIYEGSGSRTRGKRYTSFINNTDYFLGSV